MILRIAAGGAIPKEAIAEFSHMFKEAFEKTGAPIPEGWGVAVLNNTIQPPRNSPFRPVG